VDFPAPFEEEGGLQYSIAKGSARYSFEGAGRVLVEEGSRMTVEPAADADSALLRVLLLGPGLDALLHQRGLFLLHACGVVIGQSGIAVVGSSGRGKSTLAAALLKRGHRVLADDTVAIRFTEVDEAMALPGLQQVKLWPDSIEAIGERPEEHARVIDQEEKRFRPITEKFSEHPVPLRRIYLLADGESQKLEALEPQEAFLELIRHSARIQQLYRVEASNHLRQCSKLVSRVMIMRLSRPFDLSGLSSLADLIEADSLG
jgi:hypothetical protein